MLQLDKTRIAVRERSYIDLLDLALRVIRVYAWPLFLALSAGIVPMMLVNSWLLASLVEPDFAIGFPIWHMLLMALLIFLEVPLATAPATLYLGKAVFTERPDARQIAQQFRESLPQLLLYRVLLRIVFTGSSYLNEVILLDRNPMRKEDSPRGESTLSRSRVLHGDRAVDPFGQAFSTLMVGAVLLTSIWLSIYVVRVLLIGRWDWGFDGPMYTFHFPLALWIVVSYLTVVRFLSYLDLRIRREGWEVELTMRAERTRLARHTR